MKKYSFEKLFWWPLVVGAALATGLISILIGLGQSVWFDEGYSIMLAQSSWAELLALTAVDAHPPLYYLLLKGWGELFGFSELALRSLSAVFLVGAIIVAAALIRRLFSAKVALLVLPFLILGPFLLRYGFEIRMYSLALLIAVSATYALVVARQSQQKRHWLVYAVLVALGMYTLYMMIVVWFAHLVWLLFGSLKQRPRQPFWRWQWLYAFGGAVVLFIPYIPTFFYQMTNSALPGIGAPVTLTKYVDMTTVLLLFTPEWQLNAWLSLLLLAVVVAFVSIAYKTYRLLRQNERSNYWLLVSLALVPIAFYTLISLPPLTPIFVNRYLAHVSLFIYLLVGVTLAVALVRRSQFSQRMRRLAVLTYAWTIVILLFGVSSLAVTGNFIFERLQSPQTQQIRADIDCGNAVVVADDPYTYIDARFYFTDCDFRFFSQDPVRKVGGYAPLHDSTARVASPEDLTAPYVIRLGWDGAEASFAPDGRYVLVDSRVYDKQLVEVYALSEE